MIELHDTAIPAVENNGSHLPTSPDALFALFAAHQISHQTIHHPPLFTVEESKKLRGEIFGHHVKNLFLKDKKSQLFLVTALESTVIDLKSLHTRIGGQGRLSFCSAEQLMQYLGVEPGSVTPLSLINDKSHAVQFILDKKLMDGQPINVHPLVNTMTTALSREDLQKFLSITGHKPVLLPLEAPSQQSYSTGSQTHGPKC
jgi:Ala-tRNA(Pro) deacylase